MFLSRCAFYVKWFKSDDFDLICKGRTGNVRNRNHYDLEQQVAENWAQTQKEHIGAAANKNRGSLFFSSQRAAWKVFLAENRYG